MPLELSFASRLFLALISAIGVASVACLELELQSATGSIAFYGLSGWFFAAGVLFPLIRQDRLFQLRAAGAVAISVAAYRAAAWIAVDSPISGLSTLFANRHFGAASWVCGGITGAFIIMAALPLVAPLRISRGYVGLGLLASVSGSLVLWLTLDSRNALVVAFAYLAWHLPVCSAIFHGARPAPALTRQYRSHRRGDSSPPGKCRFAGQTRLH